MAVGLEYQSMFFFACLWKPCHIPSVAVACTKTSCIDVSVEGCRFLTLVDVLYEHNIRLFCSSEGLPFELFQHIMTRSQANEPKVMQVCHAAICSRL